MVRKLGEARVVVMLMNCRKGRVRACRNPREIVASSMKARVVPLFPSHCLLHAFFSKMPFQFPIPFLTYSFIAHHLRATIAIVQVVTKAYHAVGTGVIAADPSRISCSSSRNGLYALCTSRAAEDLDSWGGRGIKGVAWVVGVCGGVGGV